MKQRIYIDTSVIGGCFDDEFELWSNQFFKEVREGYFIILISDITYRELELAPEKVQNNFRFTSIFNQKDYLRFGS